MSPAPSRRPTMPTTLRTAVTMTARKASPSAAGAACPSRIDGTITRSVIAPKTYACPMVVSANSAEPTTDDREDPRLLADGHPEHAEAAPDHAPRGGVGPGQPCSCPGASGGGQLRRRTTRSAPVFPGRRVRGARGSAHRAAGGAQRVLDLADPELAEVEDARGQHGVGSRLDGRGEVLEPARPAARDDRDAHGGAHGPEHLDVVAAAGAVGVHRVEQHLADAELLAPRGPGDGVEARSRCGRRGS